RPGPSVRRGRNHGVRQPPRRQARRLHRLRRRRPRGARPSHPRHGGGLEPLVRRRVPRRDGAGPRRGPIMRSRRLPLLVALVAAMLVATGSGAALATFPFPQKGGNVYDYTRLHIEHGDCPAAANSDLPKGFDCKNEFKLTDYAPQPGDPDYDPTVENNPQELFGV